MPEALKVADTGASRGAAVTGNRDWQQLAAFLLPVGQTFKMWVRHRGGPFCFKTVQGDRWFWGRPADWSWTDAGQWERDSFPDGKLVVERYQGGVPADALQLDAIAIQVISPTNNPDPAAPATSTTVRIDWDHPKGALTASHWAINNDVIVVDPAAWEDPQFQTLLGGLHASLVRIHNYSTCRAWTKAETRDWDVEKMQRLFQGATGYGQAKIMMNIPIWPAWLSSGKVLEPEKEDEFAALCGRLARVLRDDLHRPVEYWEITNEYETAYESAGRLPDLWRLYNKIAAAIRREEPNAKLGGPAFCWPKKEWVAGFLQNCRDFQFFSWHNYGSVSNRGNSDLFATVSRRGESARMILNLIQQYAPGRHVETFLTETNVQGSWTPYEPRHQNQISALFVASVIHEMARSGVDGVMIWQQRSPYFGSVIGPGNKLYPGYYLYRWGNAYLVGQRVQATGEDNPELEVIAVVGPEGQKSVLLLNKSNHSINVQAANGLLPGVKHGEQINAQGYQPKIDLGDNRLSLPGYSLTLLTTKN